jgi:hypothetical protein
MHDQITLDRVLPFWHESIAPEIQQGKRIIIAAHGENHCCCVYFYGQCGLSGTEGLQVARHLVNHSATQLPYTVLRCHTYLARCAMQAILFI